MKDVLCFINEPNFAEKLDNDCLEKLVDFERIMVREFEDYNIPKLINALNIIDEITLSALTNDSGYRLEKTDSLRSVILYLISFKHFVDNDNADSRHVIEH